ncbi:MAG: glucose-6-phosphate dehydrogenase assembly protein OpcA [Isosphaeraceae bacterium]
MSTGNPGASSDDFLSGQGVAVEVNKIETELTRLWGPAAEEAKAGEAAAKGGHANVTRVVLSNLVVMTRQSASSHLQEVLDTVAAHFPCRTIIMLWTEEPGTELKAEVSALCHLPAPGLPQVCSERILLRAGPDARLRLPGAVRPLLEADLPFALWWTDDPRPDLALFRDLGDECTRLILDLPDPIDPGAIRAGLDPTICQHSRDTAWFGMTRWRELVAQFFDPPCAPGTLERIDSVRIDVAAPEGFYSGQGTHPNPPRLAVWFAAWLAGQLGWKQGSVDERSVGSLRATFKGPTGDVNVHIACETQAGLDESQLQSVVMTTRGASGANAPAPEVFRLVRAVKSLSKVRIEVDSPSHPSMPRTVLSPELDPARRVSAALESSRSDEPFRNAVPHALWLMES